MKTKEFFNQLKTLGYDTHKNKDGVSIVKYNHHTDESSIVAMVSEENIASIDTGWREFKNMTDNDSQKLFNLLVEYASTPIEEREEKKHYFIKHKYLEPHYNYLNHNTLLNSWFFHGQQWDGNYETQFTLKELPNWVHEMIEQGHLIKEEVK